jgi:hypothetical protein
MSVDVSDGSLSDEHRNLLRVGHGVEASVPLSDEGGMTTKDACETCCTQGIPTVEGCGGGACGATREEKTYTEGDISERVIDRATLMFVLGRARDPYDIGMVITDAKLTCNAILRVAAEEPEFVNAVSHALRTAIAFVNRPVGVIKLDRAARRAKLIEAESSGAIKAFKTDELREEYLRRKEATHVDCATALHRLVAHAFAQACGVASTRRMKRMNRRRRGKTKCMVHGEDWDYESDGTQETWEGCETCKWNRLYIMKPTGVYFWPERAAVGRRRNRRLKRDDTINVWNRKEYCVQVLGESVL